PGRLDVHLDLGRLYLAAGEFRKAEDEASFILEREPRNVGAYQLLGGSLAARQQNDRALQAFAKAAELSPQDPSSYINLALAEIGLSRFSDAEKNLESAVQVDSQSIQAYTNLANLYRLQGQMPQAEQVLEQGIEHNPDVTALYTTLADLLDAQQKKDHAEVVLNRLRKQQ